jgi:hypothetical protein
MYFQTKYDVCMCSIPVSHSGDSSPILGQNNICRGFTQLYSAIAETAIEVLTRTKGRGIVRLASYRGDPDSITGQVMWYLLWTKWRWSKFSPSTSVSPANSHSTDCSTLIIYHPVWYNRPVSRQRTKWTQSHPTSRN